MRHNLAPLSNAALRELHKAVADELRLRAEAACGLRRGDLVVHKTRRRDWDGPGEVQQVAFSDDDCTVKVRVWYKKSHRYWPEYTVSWFMASSLERVAAAQGQGEGEVAHD